ncbi:MAG TPA: response regulator transcription factor [Streptosporangiaceae bacterium]
MTGHERAAGVTGGGESSPPPIRVLAADDQRVVREGLAMLLGLLPGVEVVGTAADGEEACLLAGQHRPDVVLMDLRMPRCDGVEATRRLSEEQPGIKVIVLTTYADDQSVIEALRAGARGYLTKDAGAADIQRALTQVLGGQAVVDPAVQHHLVDAIAAGPAPRTGPPGRPGPGGPGRGAPGQIGVAGDGAGSLTAGVAAAGREPPGLPDGLTPREAEVLTLVAEGLSNSEIAGRLVVSEATVKSHMNHLLSKIGARDRAQAVGYAYRHGLVPPPR